MKRLAPLRRYTRLRKKRPTPRRSERKRDEAYLAFVRGLRCLLRVTLHDGLVPCCGPIDPHHAGQAYAGRKADDITAVPLCRLHHEDVENLTGRAKHWDRDTKRAWEARAIEKTQELWFLAWIRMWAQLGREIGARAVLGRKVNDVIY